MALNRARLLWLGPPAPGEAKIACEERGLVLTPVKLKFSSYADLAAAKGMIISWPVLGDQDVTPRLGEVGVVLRQALTHGVVTAAVCPLEQVTALDLVLKQFKMHAINIFADVRQAVEQVARAPTTPGWNKVDVSGEQNLHREEKILLRRAFSDCKEVYLKEEGTGSTKVYKAHARLATSLAGPLALPFFVKFNTLEKTKRELQNYGFCTTLHIPFNQRPNLDLMRCAFGHSRGVIVGNYVEQSESLQSAVERGVSGPPLRSLFDGALGGWRRQVYFDPKFTVTESIPSRMWRSLPSAYRAGRQATLNANALLAKEKFGASLSAAELEERLRAFPKVKHKVTLTHGDLHGENVRVTGQEAILIDFASVGEGPLVSDPATLDVSLMMDTQLISDGAWCELARFFYGIDALTRLPAPLTPEKAASPLIDAIRSIRQFGLSDETTEYEYATAVSLQLLRKASYQQNNAEGANRRILAFFLAEKLTLAISDGMLQKSSSRC